MTYCGSRTLSRSTSHVIPKFRIQIRDEDRHFTERMFSRYLWSKKNEKKKEKEVTLCAGACAVTVRRSALLQHSGVFRKMAENGELKRTKEVKLKGVTPTALRKIVQYIREDSVYFQNHREAMETLQAACLYQVPAMNDICSNFLITAIDAENSCDILEFSAAQHSVPLVEYHCLQFVDRHAPEVLRSASFLDLKRTTASDVLRRHSLHLQSEMDVFRAAVGWTRHDCVVRRGVADEKEIQEALSKSPLLGHVRFAVLSDEERSDPEVVDRVNKMAASEDPKRRSWLMNPETRPRSGTSDAIYFRSREYVRDYGYDLEVVKCDDGHSAKNGESFRARIEVLKGRVFLTGITLAFDRSVAGRKSTSSCLYLAASATNSQNSEQRSARGTFLSTSDEDPELRFPGPLVVRESESVEVALQVKRAVNVCPMVIRSDVQIAMPETGEVALKILPASERSMFRGIKYFF